LNEQIKPVYARYQAMSIPEVAHDEQAREIGQRLFLNNCAQCHGSDARASGNFPNLADGDWLYGSEPEQILQTITQGDRKRAVSGKRVLVRVNTGGSRIL